jgi:hypothetical protein
VKPSSFTQVRLLRKQAGADPEVASAAARAIAKFPGALSTTDFMSLVDRIVKAQGIRDKNDIMFAHSLCVDEVNHEVVRALRGRGARRS